MIAQVVPNVSSLSRYVELLVRLHKLIADGRGDEQEADDLRDLMDAPWYQLSAEQAQLADQLSADLYLLDTSTKLQHPLDDTFTPDLANELNRARNRGDFLDALELLTTRSLEIGAYRAMNLRSLCYFHIGFPDVSLSFAERAVDLAENRSAALVSHLIAMVRADKREPAVGLARRLIKGREIVDPEGRLFCASVLIADSSEHRDAPNRECVREAKNELEAVLQQLEDNGLSHNRSKVDCLYLLGEASYLLDDIEQAITHLDNALGIAPGEEKALMLRGLLSLSADSKHAIQDFEAAIEAGTRVIYAFYYVAYDALVSENYCKCIDVAERGLRVWGESEVMASLHELIAVALIQKQVTEVGTRQREDRIRLHLLEASRYSPFDLRYQQRLREFVEWVSLGKSPVMRIQKPIPVTSQIITSNTREFFLAAAN